MIPVWFCHLTVRVAKWFSYSHTCFTFTSWSPRFCCKQEPSFHSIYLFSVLTHKLALPATPVVSSSSLSLIISVVKLFQVWPLIAPTSWLAYIIFFEHFLTFWHKKDVPGPSFTSLASSSCPSEIPGFWLRFVTNVRVKTLDSPDTLLWRSRSLSFCPCQCHLLPGPRSFQMSFPLYSR